MIKIIPCLLTFSFMLAGCTTNPPSVQDAQPLVGSDRDQNSCIDSAGYLWCTHTNSCERPWELAQKVGFENTEQAFSGYCSQPYNK